MLCEALATPSPSPLVVYSGPNAERMAREDGQALACPANRWPSSIEWSVRGATVLLIEHGEVDDDRVHLLARALIAAGAASVKLCRLGLVGKYYPDRYLAEGA